jgi:hypothetical protein
MIRSFIVVLFCCLCLNTVSTSVAFGDTASDFDAWCRALDARPESAGSLFFSPLVGQEIDPDESARYGLFKNTWGFRSARLPVDDKGHFRLELTLDQFRDRTPMHRRFNPRALRATRLHFYLSEQYFDLPSLDAARQQESGLLWRLALRFASRGRYDLVQGVLEDLDTNFSDSSAGRVAAQLLPEVRSLRATPQALVWDQPARLGEGSNDLKLFGGYYGLWLGLALPLALESESPEAYGLGLIAGGPLGYILASQATKKWDISEGQATMIELGGNLGTWQGLGWGERKYDDGPEIVGLGLAGGLGGIVAASILTSKYEFTEGHAALTAAAMPWGAWFGLVVAVVTESEEDDDDFHKAMLIGSDALVLTTGLLARQAEMSEKRVRLISLNGVIGSVMGLGLNLLIQPDDGDTVMAIVGAGGVAGLAAGFHLTRNVDNKGYEELTSAEGRATTRLATGRTFEFPQVSVQPNLMTGRGAMPAVGAGLRF